MPNWNAIVQASAQVWIPHDPIEMLWKCLCKVIHVATAGSDSIMDPAIKDLTFLMLEATRVFTIAYNLWHTCPKHMCKLAMAQVGFHNANAAINIPTNVTTPPDGATAAYIPHTTFVPPLALCHPATRITSIITNDGLNMFYC